MTLGRVYIDRWFVLVRGLTPKRGTNEFSDFHTRWIERKSQGRTHVCFSPMTFQLFRDI